MKALGSSLVVILLATAGAPAHAQIYKWVDEAGKTHYSDTAPAVGKNLGTVADRISVYSPDPSLARAAAIAEPDPALSNRVDRLERQLHSERLARQQTELAAFVHASQSAYGRCLAERRVDCDPVVAAPHAIVVAVPLRQRRPNIVRLPFPGNAGRVVGPGILPGTFNDPNAITAGNVTFRTSIPVQRNGGGASFAPRS